MFYAAFLLGFLGSLHCIGMCGPLAISFCCLPHSNKWINLMRGTSYNLGRTVTYAIMGLLFSMIGGLFLILDLQKILSVGLGLVLVISFLFSINIDERINNFPLISKLYGKVQTIILKTLDKAKHHNPFQLGLMNGLLPCGLVYVALTGALASQNLIDGMVFMILFGLGTFPTMLVLTMSINIVSAKRQAQLKSWLPYISLCFGIFLIYRGFAVDAPSSITSLI